MDSQASMPRITSFIVSLFFLLRRDHLMKMLKRVGQQHFELLTSLAVALERATALRTHLSGLERTFPSLPFSMGNWKATSWKAWTGWPTCMSRYVSVSRSYGDFRHNPLFVCLQREWIGISWSVLWYYSWDPLCKQIQPWFPELKRSSYLFKKNENYEILNSIWCCVRDHGRPYTGFLAIRCAYFLCFTKTLK